MNYVKRCSHLDPRTMIRMTPISLIVIGYNFINRRKVIHWFLPPFYDTVAENVDVMETQVDADSCAELLIEAEQLVDAVKDILRPDSKCLLEIKGRIMKIKIFWKDGDVTNAAKGRVKYGNCHLIKGR